MFGYTKDLPFKIKNESTLEFMFHHINKISNDDLMNQIDLIGDIYEHFINREGKTMKDLGQYFTDRSLIRYLVNLINPSILPNSQIPTLWDPASGTGGFGNKQTSMAFSNPKIIYKEILVHCVHNSI